LTPKRYRAPEAAAARAGARGRDLVPSPVQLSYSRAATTSRGVRHLCRPAEPRRR
jgi:hypothetical protein